MATVVRPARGISGDGRRSFPALSRNLIMQLVGVVVIGLAMAHVASWMWVGPWIVGVLGSAWIEDTLFIRAAKVGPSARGLRAGAVGLRFTLNCPLLKYYLQNGGCLRILNGGSLHLRLNHFSLCSGRAMHKTVRI